MTAMTSVTDGTYVTDDFAADRRDHESSKYLFSPLAFVQNLFVAFGIFLLR
jgi:hypothetical protein